MKSNVTTFLVGFVGALVGSIAYHQLELRFPAEAKAQSPLAAIEAKEFRLVDQNGKLRAQMTTTPEGATALFFFDTQSRNRMNLGLYSKSEGELPFLVLNDQAGNAAGIFRLVGGDKPFLILKSDGADKTILGLSSKANGFLSYVENGTSKMAFGKN